MKYKFSQENRPPSVLYETEGGLFISRGQSLYFTLISRLALMPLLARM